MANRFGISDDLIKTVTEITSESVSINRPFGLTETNKNDKSDDGEGLDAVQPKAVKKKFKNRKDKDIDNDGDVDSSDQFLHKRRKAIAKDMKGKKDKVVTNPKDDLPEEKNAPSKENGGIAHNCASHVKHATYGEGVCIEGQHTIIETSPGEGFVTHYDVDFNGKIVEDVSVDDLEILKEANHIHSQKKHMKKEGKMKAIDTERKEKERLKNEARGVADGAVDKHNCATHVYHEEWGDGRPVPTMHADPDEYADPGVRLDHRDGHNHHDGPYPLQSYFVCLFVCLCVVVAHRIHHIICVRSVGDSGL